MDFKPENNPNEARKGSPLDRDEMTATGAVPDSSGGGAFADGRHRDNSPDEMESNSGKYLAG